VTNLHLAYLTEYNVLFHKQAAPVIDISSLQGLKVTTSYNMILLLNIVDVNKAFKNKIEGNAQGIVQFSNTRVFVCFQHNSYAK